MKVSLSSIIVGSPPRRIHVYEAKEIVKNQRRQGRQEPRLAAPTKQTDEHLQFVMDTQSSLRFQGQVSEQPAARQ
jgi:hypothetical protein